MIDIRTLVSNGLRRYPDPDVSADPLIRTIVGQLRALPTPAPSPGFREELRAQLIAVTPRLVAEGVTAGRPARTARKPHRATAPRVPIRRPAAVMGTLLLLFVMLLAGGVWMSSHTLPGDSLYGLKRASENVQLSLTGGDGARGRQYLALAKKRANEVSGLLGADRRHAARRRRRHPQRRAPAHRASRAQHVRRPAQSGDHVGAGAARAAREHRQPGATRRDARPRRRVAAPRSARDHPCESARSRHGVQLPGQHRQRRTRAAALRHRVQPGHTGFAKPAGVDQAVDVAVHVAHRH